MRVLSLLCVCGLVLLGGASPGLVGEPLGESIMKETPQDKGTAIKSDTVQRQRQAQIEAVGEVIKQHKTNQCGPDVVTDAVRTAKLIRAGELAEPLVGIIDFIHVDTTRDGGCDVPLEQSFPVVDALVQIGVPALDPIMELLKKEDVNSLKSQLGRRTLVLIYGSICVEYLENRIAAADVKDRKNLKLQLNELKLETKKLRSDGIGGNR